MNARTRVLIVDDEPNVRMVFRTALESAGFEVDEAVDGEQALACLAERACDVVLLDLLMPGLGGMDVLRQLRDASNDVPVVVVTAHGSIPDAVEAMKLGAIDFLAKPVTPDALRHVVADVAARHAPQGPEPPPGTERDEKPAVVILAPTVLDLSAAKLALNLRDFDRALDLLDEAIAIAPDSAEAVTLKGVLLETQGQDHAAYHAYKAALTVNPHSTVALDHLRRYCERYGLDADNPRINPAAGHS